ncbi:uncharacterized protein LOC129618912 [Condylostylus longicornis]|uniref:uncharacterized protein LOC129618912 n=1 Tax=Condylostylus longicornis TaxID=2530218 RepID=UPI00244E3225|nr:uncharacterized protein LOC129618912 [Condylostylus longicornis]
MFKRTKKLEPPPPPNFSDILEDLETFHVEKLLPIRNRNLECYKQKSAHEDIAEFWNLFETFIFDVDDLKRMKTELNGFKISLESNKLEIDTVSKNIKSSIEEHLENTRKVTKKDE